VIAATEVTKAIDPANGQTIGASPLDSSDRLPALVAAARRAQADWAQRPVADRVRLLARIRDYLVDHVDDLTAVIARDNGKTRTEALATEIMPAAGAIAYYCRQADRFLRDRCPGPGLWLLANKRSRVRRVPYGVIGVISPWNYPFAIAFSEVVMGLLAGNAVVLKTATETQMAGLALKSAIDSAGLPKGLFSFVNLPGRIAGEAFLGAGIDKLFFTGSVLVGKELMKRAAETLTPVCLELGGNDAMIVCADADLDRAARGAVWAGFQNAGQSCGGVERIYVASPVLDGFLDRLKRRVEALRVGPGSDFNVDMGAMTTLRQVDLVRSHVADALEKGAVRFATSRCPEGAAASHFHPAVVLTRVNHGMRVMAEETFGPVVGVMGVADVDEAIGLANDSQLGLTGSVWSRNARAADRIARRIQAGVVTINDHLMSHGLPETPWGGFKNSGIGRTHGEIGFGEMTQPQVIVHDLLGSTPQNLWWQPYSRRLFDGLRGGHSVCFGKGRQRLGGLGPLISILPKLFKR
jgi:succinate-semialdehyde dehydrogenase/glutarate-semialdehyde dehydrogenase